MDEDLKISLALLIHQPAFIAFIAAVDSQREAEISSLGSDAVVGNPQTLAAVAGAVRAYDSIRSLYAELRERAVG